MTDTDKIVSEAVDHAVEKATKDYPPLRLRPWQRVLLTLAGLLIVANSAFNGIFLGQLNDTQSCQRTVTVHARQIAQQDREDLDAFLLGKGPITVRQADYIKARQASDAERLKTFSKDCQ